MSLIMDAATFQAELRELVDAHRAHCLWWCRREWYPTTSLDCVTTLRALQRGGDVALFKSAGKLLAAIQSNPALAPVESAI